MQERTGLGVQTQIPKFYNSREERLKDGKAILFRALNTRTTVAFIGSGCSAGLGYPDWDEFAFKGIEKALEVLQHSPQGSNRPEFQLLQRFKTGMQNGSSSKSNMFVLGVCQRVIRDFAENKKTYHKFLNELFSPPVSNNRLNSTNPYLALIDLPIGRFITSNYDEETERALSEKRGIPLSEFEMRESRLYSKKRHRAFTQQPKHYDQLALFALSHVDATDNMVFHCHGHYMEPDSMVVTESDYQRWYLSSKPESDAFRQTIDLLFSSNPILFVGFGLRDEDLLRTLRMITANRIETGEQRPIFALLPEEIENADEDEHEYFFERYGVYVIPYSSPSKENRSKALYDVLHELKNDWLEWWDSFLQKPRIRRVTVSVKPPQTYHHYPISQEKTQIFGGKRLDELLGNLKKNAKESKKVLVINGAGGTGKSWCAQNLMASLQKDSDFKGFFFWSSYYSNDSLTGLDRALRYLDSKDTTKSSRLERFEKCLQADKYFLVFDGIERFLTPIENPDRGVSLNPDTTNFLNILKNPKNKSTILLTSRLWPEELGEPDESEHVKRFMTVMFSTDDISNVPPFSWIKKREEISALCSLLDGHIYCIALAAYVLKSVGRDSAEKTLQNLQRNLISTPPRFRQQRMIREAIEHLDGHWNKMTQKLLERVALFMSPVGKEVVDVCFKAIYKEKEITEEQKKMLIEELVKSSLLQETIDLLADPETKAYTVHPIVRAYIFQKVHFQQLPDPSAISQPSFTLPGFTSKTVVVDPGDREKGVPIVLETINELEKSAKIAYQDKRYKESIALCRGMFSIIRSRMGANTAPRWCNYSSYIHIIARLWDLAKEVAKPKLWAYVERYELSSIEDPDGPLYADEISWLYNEVGLASYSQGLMLNALSIWEQGYEINKVIDSEPEGRYTFQSKFNLGAAYIHFGKLNIAEYYLKEAEKTNYFLDDMDYKGRVIGYMALVKHLQANMKGAEDLYKRALDLLKQAGGNIRAECTFMLHYASLKITRNDILGAEELILQSQSLAESGYFPELLSYSHNVWGHLHRAKGDIKEALITYEISLKEARRIGIRRLESDTLSEQSRLYYDLGDSKIALQKAIEALKIANDSVLGLRQTHGLVVLGKATIQAGQKDLGISYLYHARQLARQQGYFLRKSEAEDILRKHGVEPEDLVTNEEDN